MTHKGDNSKRTWEWKEKVEREGQIDAKRKRHRSQGPKWEGTDVCAPDRYVSGTCGR